MEMEKIVEMKFGSHLYGTDTPDSDLDFKGIFCPSVEQVLLGNIPKSRNNARKKAEGEKNAAGDIDYEFYSLHYFIKLACEGQTVALDMLHAPDNMLIETSPIWEQIVANRDKFYTRNLSAFVGYARKQAAKYGLKGGRIEAAKSVVGLLDVFDPDSKMSIIWSRLPQTEFAFKVDPNPDGIQQYQVCGKTFQETSRIGYVLDILKKFYDNYGARARLAAENKGVDWKAISHAMRAAYQVKQLLTKGTIVFPLEQADFLRDVKVGKLDYATEASPVLESLMAEVEELSNRSALPEKPDRVFWDDFIVYTMKDKVVREALF